MKNEKRKRRLYIFVLCIFTIILIILTILLIFNGKLVMSVTKVINPNMSDYVSGLIGTIAGSVIGIFGAISTGSITGYLEKTYEERKESIDSAKLLINNFEIMLENSKQCVFNEELSHYELIQEYAECHGMINNEKNSILSLKEALTCLNKISDKHLSYERSELLFEFYSKPSFFEQSVKIMLEDYRYDIRSIVRKMDNSLKFISEFFEELDYLHGFNVTNETEEKFCNSVEKCYLDRITSDMNLFIEYYKKYKKGDFYLKEWDDLKKEKKRELEIFYRVLSHDMLLNITTDLSGCCIFGFVNSNYLIINTLEDYKDICKRKLLFSNYNNNFMPEKEIMFSIINGDNKRNININDKIKKIWNGDDYNLIDNILELYKNSSYCIYQYDFFNIYIREKMLDEEYIKKIKHDCSSFINEVKDKKDFIEFLKDTQNKNVELSEKLYKLITDTFSYKYVIEKVRLLLDKEELCKFIKLLIKYCNCNFVSKIVNLGYDSLKFRYLIAKQLDKVKSNSNLFSEINKIKCQNVTLDNNCTIYSIYEILLDLKESIKNI